ncbi:hypothetical protein [Variovorax paradoxus]|uniref:hypothetical protein n=1 Tax=Variovorax paradoxus TaxID=34073 RepID=UPI002781ABE5|nr:hypothetical protein [Variovorax paradoxus]MDQ0589860.1 hypothetical protein [Variovorax paradoxus]
MATSSFSVWWILVPVLAWTAFTLGVTLLREYRRHQLQSSRAQRAAELLERGEPAVAEVIALADTGQRRSASGTVWAVARLELRVRPAGAAEPFDVEQTTSIAVADLPGHAPGKTIAVRFDPASRELAVERRAGSPAYYGADVSRPRAAASETAGA